LGNTHFVENHFIKNHKVDRKISVLSLRQKYLWRFLPMDKKTKVCREAPEVLGDERMDQGGVRLGQVS